MSDTGRADKSPESVSPDEPTASPQPAADEGAETGADAAPEAEAAAGASAQDAETSAADPIDAAALAEGDAERPAAAEPSPAPRDEPRPRANAPGVGAAVAWSVAAVVLLAGGIYATSPFWAPRIADHWPAALKAPAHDPRVGSIDQRVGALEEMARERARAADAIQDLEAERQRSNEQISVLIKRLDALEETSQSLRKMVQATVPRSDAPEAESALRELTARLSELERTGQTFGSLAERVSKLEEAESAAGENGAGLEALEARTVKLNSMVAAISERIDALQGSYAASASARGAESAVLAVGQLREALRSPAPFARELALVRGLVGDKPALKDAFQALAPHAERGLPTLEVLRARFDDVAADVAHLSVKMPGDGFVERTVNKLTSLVTVRRVDSAARGDSPGAVVARADADLAKGELEAAIAGLARLEGSAAEVAAPWLKAARARLDAEQALAMLHVHAISLLGPER